MESLQSKQRLLAEREYEVPTEFQTQIVHHPIIIIIIVNGLWFIGYIVLEEEIIRRRVADNEIREEIRYR